MTITFYSSDFSPAVRSVDLVLHALDLPIEYKTMNLKEREHLTPEYVKLNPLHTIPAIQDGDFVLWESRAIMTYLVSKYGKDDSLYPKDLQKRAIVDQRLHYSNDVFYTLKQTTVPLMFYNQKAVPEEQLAKIRVCQENVEKLLEGHKYMAGDSLTLADYSYITMMDVLEVFLPHDKYPATQAWMERCRSTIKDFDKINKKGADIIIAAIKEKLSS